MVPVETSLYIQYTSYIIYAMILDETLGPIGVH